MQKTNKMSDSLMLRGSSFHDRQTHIKECLKVSAQLNSMMSVKLLKWLLNNQFPLGIVMGVYYESFPRALSWEHTMRVSWGIVMGAYYL